MDYSYLFFILAAFYIVVILFFKTKPVQTVENFEETKKVTVNQDTRYQFPLTPPVNPNIYGTEIQTVSPTNSDLYSDEEYLQHGKLLNQGNTNGTNQLSYSGGNCSLIKIPLQMNDPYNEQLRSQDILVTPYNRIKYSTNGC